jgi:hypothetical protein
VKTRLEKKEIFIPLAGGADTSGDPRAPKSPTVTAENVDFNIDNIARPRDALATFVGNVAADTPTAFSAERYMHPLGNGVVFYGWNVFESATNGGTVNVSVTNGSGQVVNVAERVLGYDVNSTLPSLSTVAHVNGSSENYYVLRNGTSLGDRTWTSSSPIVGSGIVIPTNINATAYVYGTNSGNYKFIHKFNGSWSSVNASPATPTDANFGLYLGKLGGADDHICLVGSNTTGGTPSIDLINAANAAQIDTHTWGVAEVRSASVISLDGTNYLTLFACHDSGDVDIYANVVTFSTGGGITSVCGYTNEVVSGNSPEHTDALYASAWRVSDTQAITLWCWRGVDARPITRISTMDFDGADITMGAFTNVAVGHYPVSVPKSINGNVYVVFNQFQGRSYDSTNDTDADAATPQSYSVLCRYTGSTTPYLQFYPIAYFNDSQYLSKIYDPYHASDMPYSLSEFVQSSDGGRHILGSVVRDGESERYGTFDQIKKSVEINCSINSLRIKPAAIGSALVIPGSFPAIYSGSQFLPLGPLEYPEGLIATASDNAGSNFTNAGGAGTYYYSSLYSYVDNDGRVHVSAPSPSVECTVTDITTNVTVNCIAPSLLRSRVSIYGSPRIEIYRTSANGNDFFKIGSVRVTNTSETITFVDNGTVGFTAESGVDTLLSARPLYTMNGELESARPTPHYVCCCHSGRYFYAVGGSLVYYSKSISDGFAPQFNEVLSIEAPSPGGDICSLESFSEKLFIGKERAWLVTYGEPLNDAGVGQGFAPPRIITQEAGVKYPTAAAAGTPGIFFINSVDGLIYLIDSGENVQYVGAPVRHYCETYAYDNVWYAPQDGCVRFSSATVGAPTLSFNYRYNRWSTFTGRYDDGIRAAFAAPVGPSNSYVDVVMDVNGNVYVQDPTGTNATVESFNVNISTSWISLGDILGYGKFYKWTLIGSKKSAALNLNLKTAYDYEPYWADSQDYNASALTAFSTSNQFGTMNSNTVVDQALKIQVDGSRHKTDAIRLCISTNNGTTRDSVELLGAKLEIGVRQGSTRLGSGRTVS